MADAIWRTPKTDWKATDYYNVSDHTRIADNIRILFQKQMKVIGNHDIYSGVSYPTNNGALYYVEKYNALPNGANSMNVDVLGLNLPVLRTFNAGDNTFTYNDLNDLESNIKILAETYDKNIAAAPRFDFRLGDSKGVRV